jgi:hypothetical protein
MPWHFFAILAVTCPRLPEIGACGLAANNGASRSRANTLPAASAAHAAFPPKKARVAGTKHGKAHAQASSASRTSLDFHLGDLDT